MTDFAYTTVPGKIKALLGKLRQVGIPKKATVVWLKSIGYSSSNDSTLLGVIKAIGLTDQSGIPSSVWSKYRGGQHKAVLASAIQSGYSDLFSVYPDAWTRSGADIENVIKTRSTAGSQVIKKTAATFRALCDEADFTMLPSGQPNAATAVQPTQTTARAGAHSTGVALSPTVHIDVQVHISPEASAEQIDQVFASMAKHLYGGKAR